MDFTRMALLAAAAVHIVGMTWTTMLPMGTLMPPAAILVHVPAMVCLAAFHALHHVGWKQAITFFTIVVVYEWTCEQINVSYDGIIFGELGYDDNLVGPKVGDIPLIVPFAFAALCWPSYVMVNLLLHERSVVVTNSGDSWLILIWRSVIFGLVHTSWSPAVEPIVVKFGALFYFDYKEALADGQYIEGTFFGIPTSEFRGWFMMAFVVHVLYSGFAHRIFRMPEPKQIDLLIDSTPLILYGGFAIWLFLKPIDVIAGVFTLWTMCFYCIMVGYKLVILSGEQNKATTRRKQY